MKSSFPIGKFESFNSRKLQPLKIPNSNSSNFLFENFAKSTKFSIYILAGKLFSNSQKAFTLENIKKLGEKKDNKIIYSEFEGLYLAETHNAQIIRNSKTLSYDEIIKLFSKDKYFWTKYCVFKELRKKGYIVKTGIKFGGDFRVYEKNKPHAKYICYPTNQEKIDIKELISKTRVSHSTGKKLLFAFVDKEEDVLFYEIDWVKI